MVKPPLKGRRTSEKAIDWDEAEGSIGAIGTIDELGPRNISDGSGSGWWNDPNR